MSAVKESIDSSFYFLSGTLLSKASWLSRNGRPALFCSLMVAAAVGTVRVINWSHKYFAREGLELCCSIYLPGVKSKRKRPLAICDSIFNCWRNVCWPQLTGAIPMIQSFPSVILVQVPAGAPPW